MSFELIIRAGTLEDYLDTMTAFVDESVLEFTDEGVSSEAVDPATVGMVGQTLAPSACESYQTSGVEIGVNLDRFTDYLGKANSDDLVNLTLNEETGKINIEYGDVDVQMAGIQPDSVRNGDTLDSSLIDKLEVDVEMDADALAHAVDIAGMVTDQIRFSADPSRENPLHVSGEGDTDDARIKFSSALHEGSKIPTECQSLFNEEYLKDITGVLPSGVPVRIQLGEEYPIRLTYEYADGGVSAEFAVAPRIESD